MFWEMARVYMLLVTRKSVINKKEIVKNKYKHNNGDQNIQSCRQSEIKLGKPEASFHFVYENDYSIVLFVNHGCALLLLAYLLHR